WRQRAARHGLNAEKLQSLYQGHHLDPENQQENKPEIVFALLAAPDGVCSGGSVFSASEALTALVNVGVPNDNGEPQPLLIGADEMLRLTDQFLASPHVVQLTDSD